MAWSKTKVRTHCVKCGEECEPDEFAEGNPGYCIYCEAERSRLYRLRREQFEPGFREREAVRVRRYRQRKKMGGAPSVSG